MEKPTILIVEDDGILAIHLQDLLIRQGYQVLKPVPTGEKALLAVKKLNPDLVLMDIELGGELNGISTAEQLALSTDTPVIFLTGFSQDPLLQQAKIAAPYGYLVKPVPERELAATIEMALYKHKIDHQIKVSESKYRSLIEQASDGIFLTDKSGNFHEVNSAGCKMLGYSHEEILQMNMMNVIAPENLAAVPLRTEEMADGSIILLERQFVRKDGSRFPVEISGRMLDNGNLQGIIRDITERKQAEEQIKITNERFSLAARGAQLGVWDWDITHNILVWDETMYQLYGKKKEDFSGAYEAWLNGLHPDDMAANNELAEKAQLGEQEYDTDFRVIWPDGSIHWIKALGQVIHNPEGNPIRMIGINFDITERKEAEAKLNNLAKFPGENPNPVIRISKQGYLLYANAASQDLLDYWNVKIGEYLPDEWKTRIVEVFETKTNLEIDISYNQTIYTCIFTYIPGAEYINVYGRNITDRKQIEQDLRKSEERYRHLFEEMSEGFALHEIILDKDGKPIDYCFLDVNPAFEKQTGLNKKDIIGRTVKEVLPQTEDYWVQLYGQVALTGKGTHYENYSEAIGKWFSVNSYCPKFGQFAVTIEDITSRKTFDLALQESEEQFRSTFEQASIGMIMVSPDGVFLRVNRAYCQMIGYSPDELLNQSINLVTHPEDRMITDENLKKPQEDENRNVHFEKRYLHKNGNIVWVNISSTLIRDAAGNPLHFITQAQDITETKLIEAELKKRELHFQSLIENASDGIALIDHQGQFLYVSPSGRRNFGYAVDEEILVSPNDVTHPEDLPVVLDTLNKIMQDPTEKPILEYRFRHKDGSYRWIESTFNNLLYEMSVQAIVINFRDITSRREAELKVQEQLDELRRWHANTLGREMRVIELKEEVNRVLIQAGLPPRYNSTTPKEQIHE